MKLNFYCHSSVGSYIMQVKNSIKRDNRCHLFGKQIPYILADKSRNFKQFMAIFFLIRRIHKVDPLNLYNLSYFNIEFTMLDTKKNNSKFQTIFGNSFFNSTYTRVDLYASIQGWHDVIYGPRKSNLLSSGQTYLRQIYKIHFSSIQRKEG